MLGTLDATPFLSDTWIMTCVWVVGAPMDFGGIWGLSHSCPFKEDMRMFSEKRPRRQFRRLRLFRCKLCMKNDTALPRVPGFRLRTARQDS